MTPWIQTPSGRFDAFAPSPVPPHVIALSLSRKPRWSGFTAGDHPYSVAQHSVHVSKIVPARHAPAALLHDIGEFALGDLPAPIKSQPTFVNYISIERRILMFFLRDHGLSPELPNSVHTADLIARATEARDLIPWIDPEYAASIAHITPDPSPIVPLSHSDAYHLFLSRYHELFPGRSS